MMYVLWVPSTRGQDDLIPDDDVPERQEHPRLRVRVDVDVNPAVGPAGPG